MPLRKQWRDLDRSTVARAPDGYGVYELGNDEGEILDADSGVLRDELKDALAYSRATKVRWEEAASKEQAERLEADHS